MRNRLFLFFSILVIWGCEKEFVPDTAKAPPQLVVEGYIEAGDEAVPPYVLLTQSRPFFGRFDTSSGEDFFVHDAVVTVSDGEDEYPFTEVCLSQLPPAQKEAIAQFLGINPDSLTAEVCVYLDLSFQLKGAPGKTYTLTIQNGEEVHEATTTIPPLVPVDSLYFKKFPETKLQDYRELHAFLTDVPGVKNFWRVFTKINSRAYSTPDFSIYDDSFIDGQTVEFVINKGKEASDPEDPSFFGLFKAGDTLTLKWTSIDEAHYQFRRQAEFSRVNGPFSSYVRIRGNVSDALGVWGGYNVQIIRTIVE